MLRGALFGAVVFGPLAAAAGYLWVALEFPFAIALPAFIGLYVLTIGHHGLRKAVTAALVGGVTFTAAFLVAVFLSLTDGSPVTFTAWMAPVLAALVAGALTGSVLGGPRGAWVMAVFAGAGMLLAVVIAGLLRDSAPPSVDSAGQAQSLYFAMVQGVVGAIVGAAVGAASERLKHSSPGDRPPQK